MLVEVIFWINIAFLAWVAVMTIMYGRLNGAGIRKKWIDAHGLPIIMMIIFGLVLRSDLGGAPVLATIALSLTTLFSWRWAVEIWKDFYFSVTKWTDW